LSYTLSLEADARPEDRNLILDGLTAHNLKFAPPGDVTGLSVLVRDDENRTVGGLLGGTFWGWLYIELLWLPEDARHEGIGTRLVQMAEDEARARGCYHVYLDTQSFQAREFYEKLGYSLFGVLDDFPLGHKRYYLQKALTSP